MIIKGDIVVNQRGDVLAQKVYGQWDSKEPAVLAFIAEQDKPKKVTKKKPAPKVKTEEKLVMERARDADGHFVADDPETEVNEAWVVKTVKKAIKKK